MRVNRRAPEFKINRSVISVKKNIMPAVKISPRFLQAPLMVSSKYVDDFSDEAATVTNLGVDMMPSQSTSGNPVDYMALDEMNDPVQLETISLEWDRGYFDIDWTNDMMEIEWDLDTSPEIYVEPYDIQIYVQENAARNLKTKAFFPSGKKLDKKI